MADQSKVDEAHRAQACPATTVKGVMEAGLALHRLALHIL
jgi:hypothetical protein